MASANAPAVGATPGVRRLASNVTRGSTPAADALLIHASSSTRRSPAGVPGTGSVSATSYGATARPMRTSSPAQCGSANVSPSESAMPTATVTAAAATRAPPARASAPP